MLYQFTTNKPIIMGFLRPFGLINSLPLSFEKHFRHPAFTWHRINLAISGRHSFCCSRRHSLSQRYANDMQICVEAVTQHSVLQRSRAEQLGYWSRLSGGGETRACAGGTEPGRRDG